MLCLWLCCLVFVDYYFGVFVVVCVSVCGDFVLACCLVVCAVFCCSRLLDFGWFSLF